MIRMFAQNRQFMYALRYVKDTKHDLSYNLVGINPFKQLTPMHFFELLYDECNSFYDGRRLTLGETELTYEELTKKDNFNYNKNGNLLDKVYCNSKCENISNYTTQMSKSCNKNQILINFNPIIGFTEINNANKTSKIIAVGSESFVLMGILDEEAGYIYFEHTYENGQIVSSNINQTGNLVPVISFGPNISYPKVEGGPIINNIASIANKKRINNVNDIIGLQKVSYLYYLRQKTFENYYL